MAMATFARINMPNTCPMRCCDTLSAWISEVAKE